MITPEQMQTESDWIEAWAFTGKAAPSALDLDQCRDTGVKAVGECDIDPFTPMDIAEVIAADEGENEGPDWVAVVRLKDGRYACVEAWCDYNTGWDCRAGGTVHVSMHLGEIMRLGLTQGARDRLAHRVTDGSVG